MPQASIVVSPATRTATLETYAFPILGKLPVAAIDTARVLQVLTPIWTTKTETASRLRCRIESILDWAKVRGYREGENPARWKNNLRHQLFARSKVQKVRHHAALPYVRVGAFMADLRQREGMSPRALEFAILTAARSGEVRGAAASATSILRGTRSRPHTASARHSPTGRRRSRTSRAR